MNKISCGPQLVVLISFRLHLFATRSCVLALGCSKYSMGFKVEGSGSRSSALPDLWQLLTETPRHAIESRYNPPKTPKKPTLQILEATPKPLGLHLGAGPFSTEPFSSYWEPWQGHLSQSKRGELCQKKVSGGLDTWPCHQKRPIVPRITPLGQNMPSL